MLSTLAGHTRVVKRWTWSDGEMKTKRCRLAAQVLHMYIPKEAQNLRFGKKDGSTHSCMGQVN